MLKQTVLSNPLHLENHVFNGLSPYKVFLI
jgi:hypothetical protein